MSTKAMIAHLHAKHDYKLIECTIKHTHTDECFVLSHLAYEDDAKLELKLELMSQAEMPTSFVIDDRDKALKNRTAGLITERGAVHARAVAEQQRKAPKKHVRPCDSPPPPSPPPPPPSSVDDQVLRLRVVLDDLAVARRDKALTPD
jgi:hypothetical protein